MNRMLPCGLTIKAWKDSDYDAEAHWNERNEKIREYMNQGYSHEESRVMYWKNRTPSEDCCLSICPDEKITNAENKIELIEACYKRRKG